ncbi:MAG: hypothetical protein ABTQ34_06235 [Bdellovibrionales bacterium]
MLRYHEKPVSGRLARAIEDAILLGHIKEIDAILERVDGDDSFPEDLRYGLEALRHFREHYTKPDEYARQTGTQTASNKQETSSVDMTARQIRLIESAWGSELLDMVNGETREETKAKAS